MDLGNYWSVLALLLAAAGCTTDSVAPSAVAPAPGTATVTVSRPSTLYGLAVQANVTINGAQFASLGNGETYSGSVPPGAASLTVTCSCGPGERTLRADLRPNQQYRFVVKPLPDSGAMLAGAAAGLIGQAIYYSSHDHLAPFDIVAAP